jgi:hypothetical protein
MRGGEGEVREGGRSRRGSHESRLDGRGTRPAGGERPLFVSGSAVHLRLERQPPHQDSKAREQRERGEREAESERGRKRESTCKRHEVTESVHTERAYNNILRFVARVCSCELVRLSQRSQMRCVSVRQRQTRLALSCHECGGPSFVSSVSKT